MAQLDFSKGGPMPNGIDEETRHRLSLGGAINGIDANRLTGATDRATDKTEYPTGRETVADDCDMSIDPQVMPNHNRPAIGVGPHGRKKDSLYIKPKVELDSLSEPIEKEEGEKEEEKAIDRNTGMDQTYDQTTKSNKDIEDATPDIDPSSAPQTPIDDSPNDPKDFLEHIKPTVEMTNHVKRVDAPESRQWNGVGADWPNK